MFKGSFVALITPFKKGEIDEKKIQELVEWHISEGTSGLVPMGTTGESATLSHEEHLHVIEVVVKAAKKRIPVIAGAGSNSTDEAIALTKGAKKAGADAVLSVNPYYNRPTQEGLRAHFGSIAKAVNIPIILYNIPYRTGVSLSVDTMARLADENSNIIGVKESTGIMDQTSEIVQRLGKRITVLSGDDSLTLPLLSIGAAGVVSVVANLVPRAVVDLYAAWERGDAKEARGLHLKLFPLIKAMFVESNPSPVKAAMADIGLIEEDSLRLPLVPVTKESRNKIRAAMSAFGIRMKAVCD